MHEMGTTLLWAQNRVELSEISRSFSDRPTGWISILMLVLLVALIVSIVVLVVMARQRERQERLDDPAELFAELAQAHGLDQPSRRLLKDVGKLVPLDNLAKIYVRPDQFDQGAANYRARYPRRDPAPLDQLRAQLFTEPNASAPSEAEALAEAQ